MGNLQRRETQMAKEVLAVGGGDAQTHQKSEKFKLNQQ